MMNRTAIMGVLLAIVLPLSGYYIVKHYSDKSVHMPRRYFYDSVATKEKMVKYLPIQFGIP